jgi:N-acyl amino acid synthase of PEP-CTERM/exosortase system
MGRSTLLNMHGKGRATLHHLATMFFDFKMLLDRLLGRRDLLVPYFDFETVLRQAVASAVLRDIRKLRYEVYCLECNYLQADAYDEGLEADEYDVNAIHFAAYTLDHASIIGTVRLVQPGPDQAYPFQDHCTTFGQFVFPPRAEAAEISRLVVRKTHRRRRGDSMEGISAEFRDRGRLAEIRAKPVLGREQRRGNSPLLLLGLYREMYRYSRAHGIRYWYAAMERSVARSREKMGCKFVPIGPQTHNNGPVTPHMVDLHDLNARLQIENKFLAAWFNDEPIPFRVLVRTLFGTLFGSSSRR